MWMMIAEDNYLGSDQVRSAVQNAIQSVDVFP